MRPVIIDFQPDFTSLPELSLPMIAAADAHPVPSGYPAHCMG